MRPTQRLALITMIALTVFAFGCGSAPKQHHGHQQAPPPPQDAGIRGVWGITNGVGNASGMTSNSFSNGAIAFQGKLPQAWVQQGPSAMNMLIPGQQVKPQPFFPDLWGQPLTLPTFGSSGCCP